MIKLRSMVSKRRKRKTKDEEYYDSREKKETNHGPTLRVDDDGGAEKNLFRARKTRQNYGINRYFRNYEYDDS